MKIVKLFSFLFISILIINLLPVSAQSITLDSPREGSTLSFDAVPFSRPYDVAVDSLGNVYVIDADQTFVYKFDGTDWSVFGEGDFTAPRRLTVDNENKVYVIADNGHIYRYSSSGTLEEDMVTEGSYTGVGFDSNNNLYIVLDYGYVARWEDLGDGNWGWITYANSNDEGFSWIIDIAFDSNDNLYAVDVDTRAVRKYTEGTGWETLPTPDFGWDEPSSIEVDQGGNVFVTEYDGGFIAMYNPDENTWTNFDDEGEMVAPRGIALDVDGSDFIIYIADPSEGTVFKFIYDNPFPTEDGEEDTVIDNRKTFHKDDRCKWEKPEETTWIVLEPQTINGITGTLVKWVQYTANKVDIKIDNGTGSYPWTLDKTANDGHEFLPNVASWQKIKVRPYNHCKAGSTSEGVSYQTHPNGWYN